MARTPYNQIPREFMPIRIPNSDCVQIRWRNVHTRETYLLTTVHKSSFYNHSYNNTWEGFVEEAYEKYGALFHEACRKEGFPVLERKVI